MENTETEKEEHPGVEDKYKSSMKAILNDALKYSPSKICGVLGNMVVIPIYTRLLSQAEYGLYTVSLAVLSFLCIIFSDWIGLSGLRFFKKHDITDKITDYLSTLVMILGLNMVLMFAFSLAFKNSFYVFSQVPDKVFLFILFLIIPVSVRALMFQILRAQIKPIAFTISTILNQFLTIGLAVLLIKYYRQGGVSILIAMLISITITDVLLICQSGIIKHFKFVKPKLSILFPLYKYGVPIAIASLSLWIFQQSNKVVMSHHSDLAQLGLVGVAYQLSFPLLLTLFAIMTVAAVPRIINMYEENIDVVPVISKLTEYFILIALPLIITIVVYRYDVVKIFADERFIGVAPILPYWVTSCFFSGLADYTRLQYHLANKTYIETIIRIIAGGTGLLLTFYLLEKEGLVGVGKALLISNIIYFLLTVIITIPELKWKVPTGKIVQMLLSLAPMPLFYHLMHIELIHPVLQMAGLLGIYYLIYYTLNRFFDKLKTL